MVESQTLTLRTPKSFPRSLLQHPYPYMGWTFLLDFQYPRALSLPTAFQKTVLGVLVVFEFMVWAAKGSLKVFFREPGWWLATTAESKENEGEQQNEESHFLIPALTISLWESLCMRVRTRL